MSVSAPCRQGRDTSRGGWIHRTHAQPRDQESLEETLELLSDPKAMREIRHAEAAIESGQVVTADELRRKYLNR